MAPSLPLKLNLKPQGRDGKDPLQGTPTPAVAYQRSKADHMGSLKQGSYLLFKNVNLFVQACIFFLLEVPGVEVSATHQPRMCSLVLRGLNRKVKNLNRALGEALKTLASKYPTPKSDSSPHPVALCVSALRDPKGNFTGSIRVDFLNRAPLREISSLDLGPLGRAGHVEPYIPRATQCGKCGKFHNSRKCLTQSPACAKCGNTDHALDKCKASSQDRICVNCGGAHSSFWEGCTFHKIHKHACTLRVMDSISYADALVKAKAAAKVAAPIKVTPPSRTPPTVPARPVIPPPKDPVEGRIVGFIMDLFFSLTGNPEILRDIGMVADRHFGDLVSSADSLSQSLRHRGTELAELLKTPPPPGPDPAQSTPAPAATESSSATETVSLNKDSVQLTLEKSTSEAPLASNTNKSQSVPDSESDSESDSETEVNLSAARCTPYKPKAEDPPPKKGGGSKPRAQPVGSPPVTRSRARAHDLPQGPPSKPSSPPPATPGRLDYDPVSDFDFEATMRM